jgi:hypothetical protein
MFTTDLGQKVRWHVLPVCSVLTLTKKESPLLSRPVSGHTRLNRNSLAQSRVFFAHYLATGVISP